MPKICYVKKKFQAASRTKIDQANEIIKEYEAQGFDLTLRQLYYQFVSRGLIPNNQQEYKNLGSIINDARLAGLIDWSSITDRTRNLRVLSHWKSPKEIIETAAQQFRIDKWARQDWHVECFSPDTMVLTHLGFMPIGAVQIGDKVLTHKGHFRRITKVIESHYLGPMIKVEAVGLLPVRVTPNHPLYVRSHNDKYTYKGAKRQFHPEGWVSSHELKKFDRLMLPHLNISGRKHPPSIRLQSSSRAKEVKVTFDKLTWQMIGLYLAEGSIRVDGRTVQFTLGEHEVDYANCIKSWGDRARISHHTVYGPGTCIVYLFSKTLADWLGKQFGKGAYHKHLPFWFVKSLPEDHLSLLEYYFRGDGCFWDKSRGAIAATTRSQELACQVQLLLLWAGFAASLDTINDAGHPRYRISVGGISAERLGRLWQVITPEKGLGRSRRYNHIIVGGHGNFTEFPIRSISTESYDGMVVNLEVEEDHSYCVPFIAHNCWIEKDALVGVIEGVCTRLDVPYFSCRGYTSQSEVWAAAERHMHYALDGQRIRVIHLGDHDPSGIDMTRDITDRLSLFLTHSGRLAPDKLEVVRIALNNDQVEKYNPPPNPTKLTDSRAEGYIARFGDESWELDALEPKVISDLIEKHVKERRDDTRWSEDVYREEQERVALLTVAENWDQIKEQWEDGRTHE
jgi:hypothetical protein